MLATALAAGVEEAAAVVTVVAVAAVAVAVAANFSKRISSNVLILSWATGAGGAGVGVGVTDMVADNGKEGAAAGWFNRLAGWMRACLDGWGSSGCVFCRLGGLAGAAAVAWETRGAVSGAGGADRRWAIDRPRRDESGSEREGAVVEGMLGWGWGCVNGAATGFDCLPFAMFFDFGESGPARRPPAAGWAGVEKNDAAATAWPRGQARLRYKLGTNGE